MPFFSVLVTAYNRADHVERCVRSCVQQSFQDFEVVVVDDASTDDTPSVLASFDEPRLRVVRHERNRGISPARATAVDYARGEWFVIVDSDWELLPHTLARLRELIETLPPGVRMIRSRLEWDDGSVSPAIMPATRITGYRERLLWLEAVRLADSSSDAGHCVHRCVFETTKFINRRSAMEGIWELNLARRELSMWVPEVLGREHADAPNSHSRDTDPSRVIPRWLREAPDMLWALETTLAEHGAELARYAPNWRRELEHGAAVQAFLIGDRRSGIRHTWAALRDGSHDFTPWAALMLGVLGPRAFAHAKLASRRSRSGGTR